MTTIYVCLPGCAATIKDDADAFERHVDACPQRATIVTTIGQRVLDLAEDHDCDAYDCDLLDGPCILRKLVGEAHAQSGDEEYRAEGARLQEEMRQRIAALTWAEPAPAPTPTPTLSPAGWRDLMALADFSTLPGHAASATSKETP